MTRPTKADIERELEELKRDPNTIAERYAWLVAAASGTATGPPPEGDGSGLETLVGPTDTERGES